MKKTEIVWYFTKVGGTFSVWIFVLSTTVTSSWIITSVLLLNSCMTAFYLHWKVRPVILRTPHRVSRKAKYMKVAKCNKEFLVLFSKTNFIAFRYCIVYWLWYISVQCWVYEWPTTLWPNYDRQVFRGKNYLCHGQTDKNRCVCVNGSLFTYKMNCIVNLLWLCWNKWW